MFIFGSESEMIISQSFIQSTNKYYAKGVIANKPSL